MKKALTEYKVERDLVGNEGACKAAMLRRVDQTLPRLG